MQQNSNKLAADPVHADSAMPTTAGLLQEATNNAMAVLESMRSHSGGSGQLTSWLAHGQDAVHSHSCIDILHMFKQQALNNSKIGLKQIDWANGQDNTSTQSLIPKLLAWP